MAGDSSSIDFGNLADENTDVAYLGSGSLNWASVFWLLVSEDAHMTPKSTAKHKYPLLWLDELSLFKINESRDSLVPSEVWELLF